MAEPSAHIPVIDISPSNADAARQIFKAASTNGFVYIENNRSTGISPAQIAEMFALSKSFFKGPVENKKACPTKENKGWVSMQQEMLDPGNQKRGDFKEAFNLGEFTFDTNLPNQPLPPPLSTHITTLATFTTSCHNLCKTILTLFATALEIPPDWFSSRHDRAKGVSGSITRLLYYPAIPHQTAGSNTNSGGRVEGEEQARQDDDIRAGAHSDYGSITLLFQLPGQPGLQILSEKTGDWSSVPVDPLHDCNMTTTNNNNNTTMKTQKRPLPILVNIGDLLSYWTNNLLKSTIHRVVFPRPEMKIGNGKGGQDDEEEEKSHDRYSMAYFCHPCDDAELIPVPSELVRRHGSSSSSSIGKGMQKQDTTMTAKDHLLQRLAATYGKN